MKNVLIIGYYGYANSGDEAILSSICNDLRKLSQPISITVLSNRPDETKKAYNVEAYHRFRFWDVLKALVSCDIVVMGGGSLLQDGTSSRSLYYYLLMIKLAGMMKKKVMLYANGIGPITHKFNKKMTQWIVNKIPLITLRESLSKDKLDELNIKKPRIVVTADPVFNLPFENLDVEDIKEKYDLDKAYVLVTVRPWKNKVHYTKQLATICDYISDQHKCKIAFLVMKYPNDLEITKDTAKDMVSESVVIDEHLTAEQITGLISGSDYIMSMRLHALIYAALVGTPMIGFEYDPKIAYYLDVLKMPSAGDVLNLDVEEIKNIVDEFIDNYDTHKCSLIETSKEMVESSKKNIALLGELIE